MIIAQLGAPPKRRRRRRPSHSGILDLTPAQQPAPAPLPPPPIVTVERDGQVIGVFKTPAEAPQAVMLAKSASQSGKDVTVKVGGAVFSIYKSGRRDFSVLEGLGRARRASLTEEERQAAEEAAAKAGRAAAAPMTSMIRRMLEEQGIVAPSKPEKPMQGLGRGGHGGGHRGGGGGFRHRGGGGWWPGPSYWGQDVVVVQSDPCAIDPFSYDCYLQRRRAGFLLGASHRRGALLGDTVTMNLPEGSLDFLRRGFQQIAQHPEVRRFANEIGERAQMLLAQRGSIVASTR